MAKGKGKQAYGSRRASAMDLTELDDGASDGSSVTAFTSRSEGAEEQVVDMYQDSLDQLFEKRGTVRVKALEQLVAYMKVDVRDHDAEKNCLTLVSRCLSSLRKGAAAERELAAIVLGLHIVSLPDAPESLFLEMQTDLERAASEGEGEARAAAIDALAMTCYVVAEDDEMTREVMARLETIWRKGEAGPRAAALRGWSLLFTSLSRVLRSDEVEGLLEDMAGLINDKSVDVRSAAGELVALLCSSYRFLQQVGEEEEESGEDEECDQASISSAEPANLDGLVHRMRDLATHNRHDALRASKRDKALLRTNFRAILGAVQEGTVKAEKIKLKHGDTLSIDTLSGKVALNAFKRMLGGGLQAHLQHNRLLHGVFGYTPCGDAPERLSYLEKRHFRSPSSATSKGKTAERKHDRSFKSSRMALAPMGDAY